MITVNVSQHTNSRTKQKMFVGQVKSAAQISMDEITERIMARCTATKSDTLAVISAFREQVVYAIRNGQSVSLGTLGTLYPRIRTRLADTAKDFTANNIERISVGFRASKVLRRSLQRGRQGVEFKVIRPAEQVVVPTDPQA